MQFAQRMRTLVLRDLEIRCEEIRTRVTSGDGMRHVAEIGTTKR